MVPEHPSKATRGRAASAAATKPTTTRTRAAAAAPKKRVKFDDQDGQGKENEPISIDSQELQPKATGLRAKPIRKPATAKGATRGRKTTKEEPQTEDDVSKQDILPLSPKKVTQVAKTPPAGSEDELAGDKTPLKPLSAPPLRIPMSVNRDQDITLSRSEMDRTDAPQSPTKDTSPRRLAVSPRKPPRSPFKDALKASPQKFDLGGRVAPPKFDAPSSPTKSPLKESPKRVNLGDSIVKPKLQWSKTPMKSSLFKSPARRPGSSMKTASVFSSKATEVPTVDAATAMKQVSTFKLPALNTESASSSPLRAAKSPAQLFKVHDSTKAQNVESQASIPSPSPVQEPEADVLNRAIESEASGVQSKIDELVEPADEATMSESPQEQVQQNEDPSSVDLDDMSSHAAEHTQENVDAGSEADLQAGGAMNDNVDNLMPMAPPPVFVQPAFVLASPMISSRVDDSESEDELASPQKSAAPSPLKNSGISAKDFGSAGAMATREDNTPSAQPRRSSARTVKRDSVAFTPLAMQMSSWLASSPDKKEGAQKGHKRSIFSPAIPTFPKGNMRSPAVLPDGSPAKVSFFDDEMAVRDTEDAALVLDEGLTDELKGPSDIGLVAMQASQESQASEVYGDENAAPEEPNFFLVQQAQDHTLTCTPARVFDQQTREIHTVSKVPLRPAADDTPLNVPRKRSRSLAGPLTDISMPDRLSIGRDSILSPILQDANLSMSMLPGDLAAPDAPETPTAGPKSALSTPGRSIRKAGYSNVLKGAVVHVDVHTTEGADASGIFVDLLTQMGARCVKQWHWNPQANTAGGSVDSPQQSSSPEAGTPGGKIGITHVVYKDGGKRTLEKVREAKGAVLCVGVGWVLEQVPV